jgi:hypothetical protein
MHCVGTIKLLLIIGRGLLPLFRRQATAAQCLKHVTVCTDHCSLSWNSQMRLGWQLDDCYVFIKARVRKDLPERAITSFLIEGR